MPDEKKHPTPLDILREYNASHGQDKTQFEAEKEKGYAEPEKVAATLAKALQGDEMTEADRPYAVAAIETIDARVDAVNSLGCSDNELGGPGCEKKHCLVCGGHYKIMAFNYPGPCTELCRKEEAGDHWPSRSSFISSSE